jgi:hypothetical protein
MSSLQRYFLAPAAPTTSAGFIDDSFVVVDLRRARRGFAMASSAVTQLPPGVVTPSFDELNILDSDELVEIIRQTAEAAGLMRRKKWSVALPDTAARSFVVPLESKPGSRAELNEVLAWKIERLVALPATDLRISRQRISPLAGQERYVITVAREEVIGQYEEAFERVGWTTGLMLPRHLGEAQWLAWEKSPGDKLLVSANRHGFTSLVMRNGEPLLVRSYQCEPETTADELHRFALYYRDRLAPTTATGSLTAMLVLGQIDIDEAQRAVSDATESEPRAMRATEFGLDFSGDTIRFEHLAGAAGLATLAWQ